MAANFAPGLLRLMLLREAVASVAMSHPMSCDCRVCQAARSDDDSVFIELIQAREGDEG